MDVTASREEDSMLASAVVAASASRAMTRRAAAACTPMTETWWATTSCSSRAIRSRSSVIAWSRSSSLWAAMVAACFSSIALARASRHSTCPPQNAPPKKTALTMTVRMTDAGMAPIQPLGSWPSMPSMTSWMADPIANCRASQANITTTITPTTTSMARRSRAQATAERKATK